MRITDRWATAGNSKLIALTGAARGSFRRSFALILSAYALRMELGDWVPMTEPQLLWAEHRHAGPGERGVQWTRNAAVNGRTARLLSRLMLLTGLLTAGFVIGQFVAWQQLEAQWAVHNE